MPTMQAVVEPVPVNPKAFISWAHRDPGWEDSDEAAWTQEVYAFALLLRSYGIDADLDLFHQSEPGVDWTRFGPRQVADSEWVIVALSRAWRERWEGRNRPSEGAGAVAEADALLSEFQDNQQTFRNKVVLVTLPARHGEDVVPTGLDGVHRFTFRDFSPQEIMPLIRLLTGQPEYPRGPLGPLPELSPVEQLGRSETALREGRSTAGVTSGGIRENEELIGALKEALELSPESEAGDDSALLGRRARNRLRNDLEALERDKTEVSSGATVEERSAGPVERVGGDVSVPSGVDRRRQMLAAEQAPRAARVLTEGLEKMDGAADAFLAVAMVPMEAGSMAIDAAAVRAIEEWIRGLGPGHFLEGFFDPTGSPTAGVATHRVWVTPLWEMERLHRSEYAELFDDGTGFACTDVFDARDRLGEHDDLWVLNERLIWDVGRCLRLLGMHAVQNCGASGDAIVAVKLVAKTGQPMRLVWMQPFVPGMERPAEIRYGRPVEAAESRQKVSLDEIAAVGPDLLVATRLVATDLVHAFGSPEVRQIAPDGRLRIRHLGGERELRHWAEKHGIDVSDEFMGPE